MANIVTILGEGGKVVPIADLSAPEEFVKKAWTEQEVRQLINLVQVNPGLYAKGQTVYKDKQAKNIAWNSIGLLLNPQCTGELRLLRLRVCTCWSRVEVRIMHGAMF